MNVATFRANDDVQRKSDSYILRQSQNHSKILKSFQEVSEIFYEIRNETRILEKGTENLRMF